MKILVVLTYYRPHISGLTIYAERLAKAFARRGHEVTILTSQFDKKLPREEILDGVKIVRAPVLFRLSKGVIMPTFGWLANRLVSQTDVVQLHLPQFDAAGIALRGRLLKKPTIITYHCDRIVTYTRDYAENSIYLKKYLSKLQVVPPPVELPKISDEKIKSFRNEHNPGNKHPVIGMAARFATEKGVEVLLNALPHVLEEFPVATVQFVGPYQHIIGEELYFQRLEPMIRKFQAAGNWTFLGSLNPDQMAAFFPNLDVLVLPSLNSTEAFGLVQIEAMMNGIFCVTSNLPGVRQPVLNHGMGAIFPIGDSNALAKCILDVLKSKNKPSKVEDDFSVYNPESVAKVYEVTYKDIKNELG
jgi:glycosyltransferase involved in cell wall biosynthesis